MDISSTNMEKVSFSTKSAQIQNLAGFHAKSIYPQEIVRDWGGTASETWEALHGEEETVVAEMRNLTSRCNDFFQDL